MYLIKLLHSLTFFLIVVGCQGSVDDKSKVQYVKDGQIVIIKSKNITGAFKIIKQNLNPEIVNYSYIYRSDGKKELDPKSPNVKMGESKGKMVHFGPVSIGWSVNSNGGEGWLYFKNSPSGLTEPDDLIYKISNSNDINDISNDDISKLK